MSKSKPAKKPITLDQFYQAFLDFVDGNNKRWESNEKRWEANEKRWEANEKRWEANDKKISIIQKDIKKINKKLETSFNFLDRDVMENRRRIEKLERLGIN